jgi:NADPH:quinone reductase-like Zn-dependent oxidoreductase
MSTDTGNLAWTVPASATSINHLTQQSLPIPTAGPRQVLVRLTAASLNYRDLLVATHSPEYPGIDGLPGNHATDLVPCSDGSGVIHSTGLESEWAGREGKKVLLHPNEWLTGDARNLDLQRVFGAAGSEGNISSNGGCLLERLIT